MADDSTMPDVAGIVRARMAVDPEYATRVLPASIRNNNPGAQWPGDIANRHGATGAQDLADGNKIATFPTPLHGAAAQFSLLDKGYIGMPLSAAVAKWSGQKNAGEYTGVVSRMTGLAPDTVINGELLRSEKGIELAKAMARVEAGRAFPLTDAQWRQAQTAALDRSGLPLPPPAGSAMPPSASAPIAGGPAPLAFAPPDGGNNPLMDALSATANSAQEEAPMQAAPLTRMKPLALPQMAPLKPIIPAPENMARALQLMQAMRTS